MEKYLLFINGFNLILCLGAIVYYCYTIYAARDFVSQSQQLNKEFHPPVTILKPVCGLDKETYKNLESFCCQDYPLYQIIFAVRDAEDPIIEIINQIIDNFPEIDISLVVSDRLIGYNYKVSNLANAVSIANHEILVIADSDIRVTPDYLLRIIQPLQNEKVGVVTCLYRSLGEGWQANLEALGLSTDFQASVLTARKLEGMNFAFGSTIVIRRHVLEKIGGFLAIADYLADDFQLGNLPAKAGYQVILSDYIVEHILSTNNIKDFLYHQFRWNRGIRIERFWGYVGLIFTHGIPTSLLFFLVTGGNIFGWCVLIVTWSLRLIMAYIVGIQIIQDSAVKRFFWLLPIRDLISFGIWIYSSFGDKIKWRGQELKLTKGGKLVPIDTAKINDVSFLP